MSEEPGWVLVGRFGRPHGIKGLVSVYSFTEPKQNILSYTEWYAQINGQKTQLKRLSEEEHTKFIAVLIDGYQQREKAAELTNLDILVKSSVLPPLNSGEFYWHELIGMKVVNTKGIHFGTVSEIISTGSNDVLVVTGDARCLIPFRYGIVVLDVDKANRQITVDWDNDYL